MEDSLRSQSRRIGSILLVIGAVLIVLPNWRTAWTELNHEWATNVAQLGSSSDFLDVLAGIVLTLAVAGGRTFAAGVLNHPVLTVFFGIGSVLLGIVVLVAY
ncbi:MAG: hypothetical protein ABEJ58_10640 [Halodesulfurarchaeum sp.]